MTSKIKIVSNKKILRYPYRSTSVSKEIAEWSRQASQEKWKSAIIIGVAADGKTVLGYRIRNTKNLSPDVVFKGLLSDARKIYEADEE